MVYEKIIKGRYVTIRSIQDSDAEFSLNIRQNKEKTRFLHSVENDLEKQRNWIKKQQQTEGDFFFIAETDEGKPVGTVGIYEIADGVGHLGRLLMIGNPFQTMEACLLVVEFAYESLGLHELFGDVDVDNKASMNISKTLGMHFGETEYDGAFGRWFKYGRAYKSEFPEVKKIY